ncbi:general secretion pathway protein GspB [Arenimonas sp.]|uniref:general secretion pathway protein GspB n=1 Tax=Arenimonas sp. TaxID=1872635 RepID=UPI0035B0C5CD
MSVILDALRKSEAERQRGRAPGLFVEQVALPSRRRRRPAWIFVLPALLAAGIVAGWFLRPQTNGPTVAAVPVDAPPADTAMPPPELPTTTAALPARPVPANQEALVPPPQLLPPEPEAPPAPVPAEATALPVEPLLPRLADLPAAERATLPPLKLSMHVFADEPAQRFVILDGRRQGEGASPAAGVVIEEIRRDGVVLSANGRRLLLPRP